jgi:hypothetical protein
MASYMTHDKKSVNYEIKNKNENTALINLSHWGMAIDRETE